jgi:hypothetical protein
MVLRRAGELPAAQSRLRLAVEVAAVARCAASEADARRELALALAQLGCTGEAVTCMAEATVLLELAKPAGPPTGTLLLDYPASVRAWGDLLAVLGGDARMAEEVGTAALAVARAVGCDEATQARVRVAGFLHALDPAWVPEHSLPWSVESILGEAGRDCVEGKIVALVLASRRG